MDAIVTVYNQDPYYCRNPAAKFTQMIAKSKVFNPYSKKERIEFTDRGEGIVNLICQEFTNKEIGEKLFISSRTVEGHRVKSLKKWM